MAGLTSTPTSGTVKVMGYDIRHNTRRVRQILGSVPQETALYIARPISSASMSPCWG
ncbi:MAG: hypothetical protein H0W02_19665 [Ktedonobacteraceae bacterium]|nr:hypothetical protein [Ktedonobacteraceae bacterium]